MTTPFEGPWQQQILAAYAAVTEVLPKGEVWTEEDLAYAFGAVSALIQRLDHASCRASGVERDARALECMLRATFALFQREGDWPQKAVGVLNFVTGALDSSRPPSPPGDTPAR